ncbi:MAG: CDP-diacylglycerol--serine O-phosphatidyltransferase [Ruminococcaceae bacterium]|nr:CDP-diacylglycerol--serine O-phosphatidyltransferase [Oscillospiraceae bacterium]
MRLIGFYDYTVILTYISLMSGLVGMKAAMDGRFDLAIACLALSGFLDMFDGAVARTKKNRSQDEKNFGIQLDSLCDMVCFGAFPAVFLYCSGVHSVFGLAVLGLYVLCALIRLAFFNVLEIRRQQTEGGCAKGYRGLPVTSISIILPFFYLVGLSLPPNALGVIYHVVPLITAVLFVADFSIPKPDIGKFLFRSKAEAR